MSSASGVQLTLDDLLQTPTSQSIPADIVESILSQPPFLQIPYALNLRTILTLLLPSNRVFCSGSVSFPVFLTCSSVASIQCQDYILNQLDNIEIIRDEGNGNSVVRNISKAGFA
ncbi:uncharacterized protein Bfra_004982 [Botrytis fragariae]|uniref:Uncharacterized protein n=1 Tax=Botrytis fragariae TaxID=1964551 RepID=A0A8H6AU41_9HELO|nr:uncharacterized protein Bfra_004982 [Botrytis fragariae]KAF5873520.1 hypothetical protein Bfra_004982 [Botrytis fragariae]